MTIIVTKYTSIMIKEMPNRVRNNDMKGTECMLHHIAHHSKMLSTLPYILLGMQNKTITALLSMEGLSHLTST